MPKYFFSIEDGDERVPADQPFEFASVEAAIGQAQVALADMVRDKIPDGPKLRMKVIVEDEAGREVYRGALNYDDEIGPSHGAS